MAAEQIGIHRGGPPETVLDPPPEPAQAALDEVRYDPSPERLADLARRWPRLSQAWAALGQASLAAGEHIAAYAYFRVGYHRGLDTLRAQGWRGSGYVRWQHSTNQGFLRCLRGLQVCAELIGETDEAERCTQFLLQLDPSGVPAGE